MTKLNQIGTYKKLLNVDKLSQMGWRYKIELKEGFKIPIKII
jgi:hypothetical protein